MSKKEKGQLPLTHGDPAVTLSGDAPQETKTKTKAMGKKHTGAQRSRPGSRRDLMVEDLVLATAYMLLMKDKDKNLAEQAHAKFLTALAKVDTHSYDSGWYTPNAGSEATDARVPGDRMPVAEGEPDGT